MATRAARNGYRSRRWDTRAGETGTVRLARPAAFDVTVDLSSTKENVVAHPDRVRIPKGQTTGTFTLSTNANGLCAPAATPAPCVEVTAIVGAFYAGQPSPAAAGRPSAP